MKKFTRRLLGMMLPACAALPAWGVPANPVPRTFTQPDGTKVTLSQRGDERCSYFTTNSGLIVRQDSNGWYKVVANDGSLSDYTPADFNMKATAPTGFNPEQAFASIQQMADQTSAFSRAAMATGATYAPARVLPGGLYDNADGHDIRKVPTTGSPHVLVILVNFSDKQFSFTKDPHTEMVNMMNQEGYSNFNSTGSARDFYRDQSRGLYTPQFDVYGPVTVSQPSRYYAAKNETVPEMIVEACKLIDKDVDFSIYDTNGDGEVDNVYVFYAGYGQNDGGGSSCIWPHAWEVKYAMVPPELDGVTISRYACSNELNYNYDSTVKDPTGIGTFCHEFGHVLGQPDMYATTYSGAFTPGSYSAMDHGSYNNNGRTPPNFSAYERYAMEWIKPIDITEASTIGMLPIGDGGNVYKINIPGVAPTEYWLFENRQQTGWDTYIHGHGMLVWHIDYVQSVWDSNKVNDTATHQYVDLVEADGTQSEDSRPADTFPGTRNITSFTSATTPKFQSWKGNASTLPITNITESKSGVINFNVAGGNNPGSKLHVATPAPRQTAATANTMSLAWEPVDGAKEYYVSVWRQKVDPIFAEIEVEYLPGYSFTNVGTDTSLNLEGLEESASYVAEVFACSDNNVSQVGRGEFRTFASDMTESIPVLTVEPNDVTALVRWTPMPDATEYLLTVATRAEGQYAVASEVNFDNMDTPGWTFTGGEDNREDYCGMAAPSMRMTQQEDYILSDYQTDDIAEISFWARTNRQNAKIKLEFYNVEDNGTLVKFATVTEVAGNKKGTDVTIKNIPEGVHQWLCIYTFETADCVLNLDDFVIKSRGTVNDTPVAGYDAKPLTGNSHTVEGLERLTNYVAYITARNSAASSKRSQTVHFTTLETTGVDHAPVAGDAPVFVVIGGVLRTDAGEAFNVYTADGRIVAAGVHGSVELPAPGIYIVRCGSVARTIRY